MVPIREMTDVMKIVKEQASLKSKQWIRLKRGLYKDDLAQVGQGRRAVIAMHLCSISVIVLFPLNLGTKVAYIVAFYACKSKSHNFPLLFLVFENQPIMSDEPRLYVNSLSCKLLFSHVSVMCILTSARVQLPVMNNLPLSIRLITLRLHRILSISS